MMPDALTLGLLRIYGVGGWSIHTMATQDADLGDTGHPGGTQIALWLRNTKLVSSKHQHDCTVISDRETGDGIFLMAGSL